MVGRAVRESIGVELWRGGNLPNLCRSLVHSPGRTTADLFDDVHNAALFMATSADTAPIIAEARGIVERIQQIDRAFDLLAKAPDATESVVSTLAPQDAQGLADLPSTAAQAQLRTRREGTCAS